MATCYVCLWEGVSAHVKCNDKKCKEIICVPCFQQYTTYCIKEKNLPLCTCEALYSWTILETYCPKSDLENILMIEARKAVRNKVTNPPSILGSYRRERDAYFAKMPRGILLVIKVGLETKSRKIEGDFLKECKLRPAKVPFSKQCMNDACVGLLDDHNTCLMCHTEFCDLCEAKMTPTHVCSEEDLASFAYKRSLVSCPVCNVPVERSFGCNNMTCTICRTSFGYENGRMQALGAHNLVFIEPTGSSRPLTAEYKEAVQSALALKPKEGYLTDEDMAKDIKTLARLYQHHHECVRKHRECDKAVNYLAKAYKENRLTKDLIVSILGSL